MLAFLQYAFAKWVIFLQASLKKTVITTSHFHIQKKWIVETFFLHLLNGLLIFKRLFFYFSGKLFILVIGFSQKTRNSFTIHWEIISLRCNTTESVFASKSSPPLATESAKNRTPSQQPIFFITISWRKLCALDEKAHCIFQCEHFLSSSVQLPTCLLSQTLWDSDHC